MNKKSKAVILIPLIAVVLVLMIVLGANYILHHGYVAENSNNQDIAQNTQSADSEDIEETGKEKQSYIMETNYHGELEEYPELYEIPFKKSDWYINNRDFSKENFAELSKYQDVATSFMEKLLNVDYRTLAKDPDEYIYGTMAYADYEAYITIGYGTDTERTMLFYEYIGEICDYFIENQIQIEAKFLTADTMVYSDYHTFVRGELVFTIYESKADLPYIVGNEYSIPMEVALCKFDEDDEIIHVCAFGHADDETFFLNP